MRSVKIVFLFLMMIVASANAQVTDAMFKKFNDIKMDMLTMDLKMKSASDSVYTRKLGDLEEAYRAINEAYWTNPKKVTGDIAQKTTLATSDLVFLKIPLEIIKTNATQEACSESWNELLSLKKQDAILFEHFKAFIKARCNSEYTPGI